MELLRPLLDLFLNLDVHLATVVAEYGAVTYVLLFLIVFCETGLVVTPFLPGDSLLFAAGAFAGLGALDPVLLIVLLSTAAIVGDSVNYATGSLIGPRVFKEKARYFHKQHLLRTEKFYASHGGKTIVLARFIPIIRTFAPFVAGIGSMSYPRFLSYNVFGGILWVLLFVLGGYFFGTIPLVQANFEWVVLGIIILSFLPVLWEWWKGKQRR